ncbi:MAG: hypothetical protein JJU20_11945 [Opitutales bacterium]|nr:hypothetical protein [Opitutales bacterium]
MESIVVEDAAKIRANQWKQGCVLLPEKLPSEILNSLQFEEGQLFYVLTHDCDLVQADFTKEPYVELLKIKPMSTVDGNLIHGKNSRQLDFKIGESSFRASCHDRYRIDRRLLAGLKPSEIHPNDERLCDLITDWIAKRYIRPAFPDAFNIRLGRESRTIKQFLKKFGHVYERVYMVCDPQLEELNDDADYKLTVWLVFREEDEELVDVVKAQKLVVEFEQILNGCRGIDVCECLAVGESEVTLAHLRTLSLWDFDYLTRSESDS